MNNGVMTRRARMSAGALRRSRTRGIVLRLLLAALCLLGASLAELASVATAEVTHSVISRFHGEDAPEGPLGPLELSDAIDQSTGDVYALESNTFGFGIGLNTSQTQGGAVQAIERRQRLNFE